MYEAHFGLKSRPFGSRAEGAGVFSGPRQVETMTKLKKGLSALDAVVTITGPVGVGKTTAVSRALDTISPNRMAAWVGRMQLAPDEVLQLLLAGFGIKAPAKGTIQRFAVFRRLLAERAAAGAPVAIVVEDAQRLGVDALAELEALTAADTGDATSANIILMGQPDLKKLLAEPELARLNQRTRLRQAIEPLSQPEVNGYLKHCIRVADGDFDELFETGVAEIIYACSGGIPRVINTLCESALTTAMEDGLNSVSAALMHKVAVDAFGYEGPLPENVADTPSEDSVDVPIIEVKAEVAEDSPPEPGNAVPEDVPDIDWEKPPAAEPVEATDAGDDEDDLPAAARDIVVESGRFPELPEAPEDSPLSAANDSPEEADNEHEAQPDGVAAEPMDVPELINDTQPELSTLNTPQTDEPVAEMLDVDTESTAIQERLPESAIPATEPEPVVEQLEIDTTDKASVGSADTDDRGHNDDEKFDLDAALSIETDSTNVMEGITPSLDVLAAESNSKEVAADSPPQLDDLPTLTDSMQVDVEKEVERAKNHGIEPEPAATEAQPKPETATEQPDKEADSRDVAGAAADEQAPAAETAARTEPEIAAKPEPEPEPELAAEPEPEIVAEVPPPEVAEPQPAAEIALETDLPVEPPEEEKAPIARPVAQVSEMTARIAALDPANRANDVDALEAALDAAKSGKLDEMMAPPPIPEVNGADSVDEEPPVALPEITLDDKIESEKATVRPVPEDHLKKIGQANSLEEFSDDLAETLFGNEDLDQIAAAVVANPPAGGEIEAAPVRDVEPSAEPAAGAPELSLTIDESVAEDVVKVEPIAELAPMPVAEVDGLRESQQVRADMLQSIDLNDEAAKSKPQVAEEAEKPAVQSQPEPKGSQPESIENQINTSITQTLEALNVTKMADDIAVEKEEKEEKKGGLFSRFRKSS